MDRITVMTKNHHTALDIMYELRRKGHDAYDMTTFGDKGKGHLVIMQGVLTAVQADLKDDQRVISIEDTTP